MKRLSSIFAFISILVTSSANVIFCSNEITSKYYKFNTKKIMDNSEINDFKIKESIYFDNYAVFLSIDNKLAYADLTKPKIEIQLSKYQFGFLHIKRVANYVVGYNQLAGNVSDFKFFGWNNKSLVNFVFPNQGVYYFDISFVGDVNTNILGYEKFFDVNQKINNLYKITINNNFQAKLDIVVKNYDGLDFTTDSSTNIIFNGNSNSSEKSYKYYKNIYDEKNLFIDNSLCAPLFANNNFIYTNAKNTYDDQLDYQIFLNKKLIISSSIENNILHEFVPSIIWKTTDTNRSFSSDKYFYTEVVSADYNIKTKKFSNTKLRLYQINLKTYQTVVLFHWYLHPNQSYRNTIWDNASAKTINGIDYIKDDKGNMWKNNDDGTLTKLLKN